MAAHYRVDLRAANNEDLRQAFALSDQTPAPLDLTGASLRMTAELLSDWTTFEISTGNGRITLANAAAGQFEISVPAAVMRTLSPGSYRHDLLLTMASGAVHRVWSGALTLERGVTA